MPELIPAEPGSPEWLAARKTGVTATDIVTILGLSHHDSVYSLFWRKLGQVPEMEDRDRFRLGRELERYVMIRWHEQNGGEVRPGGLYRSAARPWQLATLDATIPAGSSMAELMTTVAVLELKSWADADRHSWGQGCGYDEHGLLVIDDQVPPQVRAQVLWQMDVMDVSTGHVGVVFLPSGEFRSFKIDHVDMAGHFDQDEAHRGFECSVCHDQQLMRFEGEQFMRRLRLELPPPDPDSSAATLAAVRARFARQPAKQAEVDPVTWDSWVNWKEAERAAADLARGLEIELRHQAGEAAALAVNGEIVARRVISDAQVKAHVRHQDYIRRVKQQGDGDE